MTRHRCRKQRDGSSLDRAIDRLVPAELRYLSAMHWTPVRVAARVAILLRTNRDTRILDVGSGVGKVCSIGALAAPGTWVGVEQHATLVQSATALARALGVEDRTRFLNADAFSIDWSEYDALYFYNPFELALLGGAEPSRRSNLIPRAQERLAELRNGTRVVTFHGFGGPMPPGFELLYHERVPEVGLDLTMWVQRSSRLSASVAS